jgi:hypothetical protein
MVNNNETNQKGNLVTAKKLMIGLPHTIMGGQ